jgi:hypothetical protein
LSYVPGPCASGSGEVDAGSARWWSLRFWGPPQKYDPNNIFNFPQGIQLPAAGAAFKPTSFRSPWQNAYAERLIGSIRRECVDHIVVFGERHLRHVLLSYQDYYNATRTHLSLNKDAPLPRGAERAGTIVCRPILGGLHHQSICPDLICDKDRKTFLHNHADGIASMDLFVVPTISFRLLYGLLIFCITIAAKSCGWE